MEKTDLEHDRHLINFLDICRKEHSDAKSRQKCNSGYHRFHSLDISGVPRGLSPDPKKVAAVKRMDLPEDVKTMRSFSRTCELPQQILVLV